MAGWQLVKYTSTYFVSPFWRGVGRSFIDTIKTCTWYKFYGGLVHFAGRGVGKCMYVRMYGHHIKQSMDRPGKVANPARGQLNRENEYSPIPVRA